MSDDIKELIGEYGRKMKLAGECHKSDREMYLSDANYFLEKIHQQLHSLNFYKENYPKLTEQIDKLRNKPIGITHSGEYVYAINDD